jgi:hypothetical protein
MNADLLGLDPQELAESLELTNDAGTIVHREWSLEV